MGISTRALPSAKIAGRRPDLFFVYWCFCSRRATMSAALSRAAKQTKYGGGGAGDVKQRQKRQSTNIHILRSTYMSKLGTTATSAMNFTLSPIFTSVHVKANLCSQGRDYPSVVRPKHVPAGVLTNRRSPRGSILECTFAIIIVFCRKYGYTRRWPVPFNRSGAGGGGGKCTRDFLHV